MEEAAAAALKAGCDILLLCGATENTQRVYDALLGVAKSDADFRRVVERSAEKIRLAKERTGISRKMDDVKEPDFDALRKQIGSFSAEVRRRVAEGSREK
jgi:beta-glucosidase-like glycosyl hydrolase